MLGYASVSKLLGEVSSAEISEWQAYFRIKQEIEKSQQTAERAKQNARKNNR